MEITHIAVVSFITYVIAEVLKVLRIDPKYIPIVNIFTGIAAAVVCYFTGILPAGTPLLFLEALGLCVIASYGAGGFYDLLNTKLTEQELSQISYKKASKLYGEPNQEIEQAPATHEESEAKR